MLLRPSELILHQQLKNLATLIQERNEVDDRIAALIGRPAQRSHVGEYIARCMFDITEPESASNPNNDGEFIGGSLSRQTVNIKFYGKDDGVWNIKRYPAVDYYLLLTGALRGASSSRGQTRPLSVARIYLMPEIVLQRAGVKPGAGATVRQAIRDPYVIYPAPGSECVLRLTDEQCQIVQLFADSLGA